MAANLGTWLGLFSALIIVLLLNKKIKRKIKREVKVYESENITVAKEKPNSGDGGNESVSNIGKRKIEGEGNDEGRSGLQDKPNPNHKSNKSKPGKDSTANKSSRVAAPRIEPI